MKIFETHKKAISIFVVCLIIAVLILRFSPPNLSLTVTAEKTVFTEGETINVTVTLRNEGCTFSKINEMSFRVGNLNFEIKTYNGSVLPRKNKVLPGIPGNIMIKPGEAVKMKFNLIEIYNFENVTGPCTIKVIYASHDYYEDFVWGGEISSNTLGFTVTPKK